VLASRRTGAPVGLALAVLVVVSAVLAGAYVFVRGPDKAELTVNPQQAPLHADVTKVSLPPAQTLLAGGTEGLWVARQIGNGGAGRLIRFDPSTMQPENQWPLDVRPLGLAVGGGSVWVFGEPGRSGGLPVLLRINAKSGEVLHRLVPAGRSACSTNAFTECDPVVAGGGVWMSLEQQLVKVSLDGTQTERTVQLHGRLWDVAAGAGSLWALADRALYRIDPRTGTSTQLRLGDIGDGLQPNHLAVGQTSVWISSFPTDQARLRIGRLTQVAIGTGTPRIKTFIYPGAASLALLDGGLWIDRFSGQGELDRVSADTGVLTGPIVTNLDDVTDLVTRGGELWAVTWNPTTRARTLVRIRLNPVSGGVQ
jgi:hypothetical protein